MIDRMDRVPGWSRAVRLSFWSACLAPAAWLAFFYLFVLRARLVLGRWPYYGHPDPKDLGFDLHHALLWFGLISTYFSPAVLPPALVLHWSLARPRERAAGCIAFVLGYAIWFSGAFDPSGRLLEWFAD